MTVWKFPCDEAMRIPPGPERGKHIRGCMTCQRLLEKRKEIMGF